MRVAQLDPVGPVGLAAGSPAPAAPGRRSASTSPSSRRGGAAAGGPPRCRGRARASGARPPRPSPRATRQSSLRTEPRAFGDGGEQVGDRAEDVELDLPVGGVADADRPGAGVPGQRVDDGLGPELEPVDRVERVQPLRVPVGAVDARRPPSAGAPRPPPASRGRPGRARSSPRRAASSTGSPSCGRRRAPRAARWSPRRGSSRSAAWQSPRSVSALRSTVLRSPSPAAAASPPSRATAARPAPAGRRSAPDGGSRFVGAEAQLDRDPSAVRRRGRRRRGRCRGRRRRRRPTRPRARTARSARWSRARAARRRAAASWTGTWPNSGRGANSSRATPGR